MEDIILCRLRMMIQRLKMCSFEGVDLKYIERLLTDTENEVANMTDNYMARKYEQYNERDKVRRRKRQPDME